ncbi:peptidoglycan-associated lipoprotein Pal [Thiomicrorhabdus sediminis]|uniref:Peptidoglycan-associated protein n=1 Tax=Thiomicrorhabdus sediminis TaxID=2580412 RepID=A0A4P9K5Y1_9GAMM|nr:peptidoglycan-associated lipoprotein Pal [Thiomicrorhabdus sediminis]QCU90389.1 peptidoglycan-associated lipoprotein Pal [Thiomicrorhabdus sediminis]
MNSPLNHLAKLASFAVIASLAACSSNPSTPGAGNIGNDAEVYQDTAPGVGSLNHKGGVEVMPADAQRNGVNGGNLNGAGDLNGMQMVDVDNLQESIIYFGYDQYQLDDQATEIAKYHADILLQNPKQTVTLNGHTDERGTPEYNLALGEKRAKAVAQALMLFGVAEARINVVSFGEESPQIAESNENAWAKNRRVEIVIQ